MPGGVTHFIVPMLLVQIFRDFFWKGKKFSFYYIVIAGFAGIAPDLDVAVYWFMYKSGIVFEQIHRVYSHTIFVPLTFLMLGLLALKLKRGIPLNGEKLQVSAIAFLIALGTAVHLFLDWLIIGPIFPFSPFSMQMSGLNLIFRLPFSEFAIIETVLPVMEWGVLMLWLAYQEYVHEISKKI